MKRYLRFIALFLFPLIAFFSFIEYTLRKIPNDFKYKAQYLDRHSDSLEVLILGSSHSLSFIRPKLFKSNTFNAANLNQTLKYDDFILEKYIDKMKKLKYLILPISYGTYFISLEDSKENWRVKDYKLYFGYEDKNPLGHKLEVTNGSTPLQLQACIDYWFYGKDQITCSPRGFGIKFARDPQADMEKTGKMVAIRHTANCKPALIEENISYLKHILKICKDHNISVVLYTAPAYFTYRDNIDKAMMKQTYAITDSIVKLYPNVRYINYFEDKRFEKQHYRDVDHLNEKGSELFTRILLDDFGIN